MTVIFRFSKRWILCFYGNCVFLFSLYATVRNVTGLYLNFNDLREGYLEHPPPPPPSSKEALIDCSVSRTSILWVCVIPVIQAENAFRFERERSLKAGFRRLPGRGEHVAPCDRGIPAGASGLQKFVFTLESGVSHLSMDDRPCWDSPVELFKPGALVIFLKYVNWILLIFCEEMRKLQHKLDESY